MREEEHNLLDGERDHVDGRCHLDHNHVALDARALHLDARQRAKEDPEWPRVRPPFRAMAELWARAGRYCAESDDDVGRQVWLYEEGKVRNSLLLVRVLR